MSMLVRLIASAIVGFARFITAVRGIWAGTAPSAAPRIYFANHTSMGDFVLIWTVIPSRFRLKTRPVAGSDYWLTSKLKTFIGKKVFNAVLIDRTRASRQNNPVNTMAEALAEGSSLILFPEGTRNTSEAQLLPFKSGLYHLAKKMPDIELVPVWIDNLNRVLPKGEFVPIPLICTVTFGEPMQFSAAEEKGAFLARAEQNLLALAPTNGDVA